MGDQGSNHKRFFVQNGRGREIMGSNHPWATFFLILGAFWAQTWFEPMISLILAQNASFCRTGTIGRSWVQTREIMGLNYHFSFGALFSRKNEGDHGFKPGLVPEQQRTCNQKLNPGGQKQQHKNNRKSKRVTRSTPNEVGRTTPEPEDCQKQTHTHPSLLSHLGTQIAQSILWPCLCS